LFHPVLAGLYVYNKIDVCSMEEVDEIARRPHSIPISCYQKLNFDGLLARIWDMMVGGKNCILCLLWAMRLGRVYARLCGEMR
jgi:50S ribosomal subunit-associated GTPase HflX